MKKWKWPGVLHRCYRHSFSQSVMASLAFFWYGLKKYEKHIDRYFVLSQFQYNKIATLISPTRIRLKPNPINENLSPITSNKKNYLFVGRLEKAKGIDWLLSTWKELPSDFHLEIIGLPGLYAKKYQCSHITFLGQLSHAKTLKRMQHAKYVLQTSLTYETFGLTILEAFSQGTPVIGLHRGTRPEFIHSGKNGFLCHENNLKETILMSKDFPQYKILCENAYESAKPFYLSNIIQKQILLYKEIMLL